MSATCPNCRAALTDPNASRCLSCGRSLLQVTTTRVAAPGQPSPPSRTGSIGGWLAEYFIHLIISLISGIVGFVIVLGFFRRVLRRSSDEPLTWILIFVIGFCLPTAYGFYYSYRQDQIAKRRKAEGIKAMR